MPPAAFLLGREGSAARWTRLCPRAPDEKKLILFLALAAGYGAILPRAMARYLELRCPTCVEVFARIRTVRLAVGRPFEECPKCRTPVGRPSTNEWDLLGPGEKLFWLAARSALSIVIGLVPALAYGTLAYEGGAGDLRILLALALAGPALVLFFPLSGALHAIRRSRARMADPMYRARMVEFARRRA